MPMATKPEVVCPFDHVVCQDTKTIICISTTTVSMVTKVCRMVTYLEGLLAKKSHDPSNTWSFEITWQIKIISSLLQCLSFPNMAGLWISLKTHDSLITCSCKITWQVRTILCPLPLCPWPPNLAEWWLTLRPSCLISLMALDSRGLARLRDNSQTWHDDELPSGVSSHKVTWLVDHQVLRNHMTN